MNALIHDPLTRFIAQVSAIVLVSRLLGLFARRISQPLVIAEIAAGDPLVLLHRPHPAFSVARVLALIRDRVTDVAQVEPVLQLPLPPSWRRLFEPRLNSAQVEDWSRRLWGPR